MIRRDIIKNTTRLLEDVYELKKSLDIKISNKESLSYDDINVKMLFKSLDYLLPEEQSIIALKYFEKKRNGRHIKGS